MLELADDRPQVNQSLSLIGYPEMAPSPLTLSRRFAGQKGLLYALDQRVGEGLSGGPVVLDGRAIGMVTAVDGEFTYAVSATVIREFLRGSGILLPDTAVQPQGQAAPPPQVNPDPVNLVLDEAGLMWTKMDNGQDITWNEAMILCESLSIGGNRDWRLPTIEELERLYDPGGVVNIKRPFLLTFRSLWSSTRAGPDTAWMFDFPDGRRYPVSLGSYTRLLCVRGPVR
jgi:CBS domain-containing protein